MAADTNELQAINTSWQIAIQEISRIDCFSRSAIRRMMFKSPMWITPLPPSQTALAKRSHGSVLNGNYALTRLSSAWKSTDLRI
jgi:hypothetical protein